jgi:hypothetical protein
VRYPYQKVKRIKEEKGKFLAINVSFLKISFFNLEKVANFS